LPLPDLDNAPFQVAIQSAWRVDPGGKKRRFVLLFAAGYARRWTTQENGMRKWDSEIFNNNHLRLMKCHIGMAIVYFCFYLFWFGVVMLDRTTNARSLVLAIGFLSPPVLIHLALAYGSYRRIELSRKASEIVFAILLLAFPIGTFLSIFLFLPATEWQVPEDNKP
jgi:hypothetical protein